MFLGSKNLIFEITFCVQISQMGCLDKAYFVLRIYAQIGYFWKTRSIFRVLYGEFGIAH